MDSPPPRHALVEAAARAYEAAHGNPLPEPVRGFRWRISPRVGATAVAVVAVMVATAVLAARPEAQAVPEPPGLDDGSAQVGAETSDDASLDTLALPGDVVTVHVAGAVNTPGVFELPGGSRVADAIDAAGGALANADTDSINLARRIADGEQVLVQLVGESSGAPARLNLNSAEPADLEALPGIGTVLAERIVADRAQNGPFATVDDLDRVSGVGDAVLAQIRDLVTV